jgi:hypothetical protein
MLSVSAYICHHIHLNTYYFFSNVAEDLLLVLNLVGRFRKGFLCSQIESASKVCCMLTTFYRPMKLISNRGDTSYCGN